MSQAKVNPLPPRTWEAEGLRLTTFFRPEADVSGMRSWWTTVAGIDPDVETSRQRLGQLQTIGVFEGRRLALLAQPGRIDWNLLAATQAPDDTADGLFSIGPLPEALQVFSKVVRKWLEVCPPVARLAFGAVLIQPTDDRATGFTRISGYLSSLAVDLTGSSDFLYQINRARNSTSGIDGLNINRLSRWSVMLAQTGLIQVALGSQMTSTFSSGSQKFACRLELDINTSPDFPRELPKDKLTTIFEELVELGQEVAEKGDIP